MGKKKKLTEDEKNQIIKYMSENLSTIEIAKKINLDHRTLKMFCKRKRSDKGKFWVVSAKTIHKIKR